jgi:hypothetical protein
MDHTPPARKGQDRNINTGNNLQLEQRVDRCVHLSCATANFDAQALRLLNYQAFDRHPEPDALARAKGGKSPYFLPSLALRAQ